MRDARDVSLKSKKEFSKPRNWVDFLRALAASLAVCYFAFEKIQGEAKIIGTQIFVLQCVVFVIAVLIQTVRFSQGRLTLVAPIFFILGLSFGFIGWKAALFACIAVWVLNRVLPGPGVFLVVFAALEIAFGLLLSGAPLSGVILAVFLAILPILLSGVMKRRLVRLDKPQKKPM